VPLYDVAEVLGDPQVKHLGLIEEVEHPVAGKLKFVGGPVRFDDLAKDQAAPPPLVASRVRTFSAHWATTTRRSKSW